MGDDKMATRRSKVSFTVKRVVNFLRIFRHNRRGLAGLVILVFFSAIAFLAPLISPHDPVRDDYLAGDYAEPQWFSYLPGGERLNFNLQLLDEPGFTSPSSLDEWDFSHDSSSDKGSVHLEHSSIGTDASSPGSAVVMFKREDKDELSGTVRAHLTKEFSFPYSTSPKRFNSQIAVLVEGAEDVPVELRIFILREENESYTESFFLGIEKFSSTSLKWVNPTPSIDSYNSEFKTMFGGIQVDPAAVIFSKPGNYTYDVQLTFRDRDEDTLGRDVEAKIYIDDLNMRLYGTGYGLLGTDYVGRDIFAQLIHGARISLIVGLLSAVLSVGIGLVLGLVSGYLGRLVDEVVMRFTDMMLVIPQLPLLLVLIAVLGPSIYNLILLIGLLGWMSFARIVRSQVLSLKERPFVEAARAVGAGKFHIISSHILPNVMSLVYVTLALSVPTAIISEAALSWLGLFDPRFMSWGRMLYDAQVQSGIEKWWWTGPPGICIAAVSVSFILLGYALDEILNPKLRRRR